MFNFLKHAALIISITFLFISCKHTSDMKQSNKTLFIANYMNVFGPTSYRGGQLTQGHDFFPLIRLENSRSETNEEEIKAMIRYGFNGLQVWPDYGSTVKWLNVVEHMTLKENFYIFPQIAGIAHVFFPTYKDFVDETVNFLKEYGSHPKLLKIDGRPVLSSWGSVKYLKDLKQFRQDVNKHGVDFYWLATMDTAVKHPNLKALSRIRDNGYDGYNSWRNLSCSKDIRNVCKLMSENGNKCDVFGSFLPGYDNRNRMFMDNYRIYNGAGMYIQYLDAGLECNLDKMIMVTWNDIHETACMPSWRSPGGYEEITRFYRGIYDKTGSPFKSNKVVACYQPEQLLGDMIRIQFILLPGRDAMDWNGVLELRDINDKIVFKQKVQISPENGNRAIIKNIDIPSLKLENDCAVLSPCVAVGQQAKRLSPLYIRVDRMLTRPPLVIALDKVAADIDAEVDFVDTPQRNLTSTKPVRVNVTVKSKETIKQLQLADSAQILLDVEPGMANQVLLFPVFDNWGFDASFEVELENASFRWLHQFPNKKKKKSIVTRLSDSKLVITPSKGTGFKKETPFVVTAIQTTDPSKTILTIKDFNSSGNTIKLNALDLAAAPAFFENDSGCLRIRLAEDGHSLPEMTSLNTNHIAIQALLPNIERNEPFRGVFCEGELVNGKVFYSKPLLWLRHNDDKATVNVQVLDSGKAFDETIRDGSIISINDFDADQIRELQIPSWRLPMFNFDFDEGKGWYVNDGGCYSSRGFGWLANVGSRKSAWGGPGKEDAEWLADGIKGSAMTFKSTSKINMRSGTMPVGAFTFLCWIKPDKPMTAGKLLSDCHFSIELNSKGQIAFSLRKTARDQLILDTKESLKTGQWQQLAVTYDLSNMKIYINGKLVAQQKTLPLQSRVHSKPYFGALSADKPGFSGILDETFFIGRALSAKDVKANYTLYSKE